MKPIETIVSQKLRSQTMPSLKNDLSNSARFQIAKQFLVSSHPDSLQITWLGCVAKIEVWQQKMLI